MILVNEKEGIKHILIPSIQNNIKIILQKVLTDSLFFFFVLLLFCE